MRKREADETIRKAVKVMGMKILVTGANGYLGQGIVAQILDNGHQVVAADLDVQRVDARAECFSGDIFSLQYPYRELGEPDALLHLAWRDGFIHNSDAHIVDLPKHYLFLKQMLEDGLQQICVMGSMHEIGFFEGSIKETTPCHPMSLYGIAKNALRDTVELMAGQHGAVFQWLRGYYIVGNARYGSSIFTKILEAEEAGKAEFPFTTGQNQYDFLDYKEFCEQVAAAVGQREVNGIINIASGRPERLADRVEAFIQKNQYKIKLKYGAFPDRPYDSKAVWGDVSKITKILEENKYKNN